MSSKDNDDEDGIKAATSGTSDGLSQPPLATLVTVTTTTTLTNTTNTTVTGKGPNIAAVHILTDLVEYHAELISLDPTKRLEHWDSLRYFWGLHVANQLDFGRLYYRVRIAELIKDACGFPPYGHLEVQSEKSHGDGVGTDVSANGIASAPYDYKGRVNLVYWDRDRWNDLRDDIDTIVSGLARKDAPLTFQTVDATPDESIAPNRDLVPNRVGTVRMLIELHKALAPLRQDMEEQLFDQTLEKFRIDSDRVAEFSNYVGSLEEGSVKSSLEAFLVKAGSDGENGKEVVELATPDDVRPFLEDNRAYDLNYFQTKIENLVNRWNVATFGKRDPLLIRLKYRLPAGTHAAEFVKLAKERRTPPNRRRRSFVESPKAEDNDIIVKKEDIDENVNDAVSLEEVSKTPTEIEFLRQGRTNLATQHGDDPLDESCAMAAEAKRPRDSNDGPDHDDEYNSQTTPRSSKRARTSSSRASLEILQDLDKDDEEDEEERTRLSEVPEKLKPTKSKRSPATAFRGQDPDDGIFDQSTGLVLKRRRWTDEEKVAVKEGVRKHGVGHWVKIKDEYADILRNRTAIQIKDCWRTMTKRNEIRYQRNESVLTETETEINEEKEEEPVEKENNNLPTAEV